MEYKECEEYTDNGVKINGNVLAHVTRASNVYRSDYIDCTQQLQIPDEYLNLVSFGKVKINGEVLVS